METYDILIKNGLLLDGTGIDGFHAQLASKDGKIVKITKSTSATADAVIDAAGQVALSTR